MPRRAVWRVSAGISTSHMNLVLDRRVSVCNEGNALYGRWNRGGAPGLIACSPQHASAVKRLAFSSTGREREKGVQMHKRNVQSFLMVSAAFFAMNLPVPAARAATPDRLAAAVSHGVRMAGAGVGPQAFDQVSKAD